MVIAIDNTGEFDYILKDDRDLDEQEQTTWRLRRLTKREMARVADSLERGHTKGRRRDVELEQRHAQVFVDVFRVGLVGWENWRKPNGEQIAFATEDKLRLVFGRQCKPIREELLEHISFEHLAEIAAQILGDSDVDEEDLGN